MQTLSRKVSTIEVSVDLDTAEFVVSALESMLSDRTLSEGTRARVQMRVDLFRGVKEDLKK